MDNEAFFLLRNKVIAKLRKNKKNNINFYVMTVNCKVKFLTSVNGCVLQIEGVGEKVVPLYPFGGHAAAFVTHECILEVGRNGERNVPKVISWKLKDDTFSWPIKCMTPNEAVDLLKSHCRFLLKEPKYEYILADGLRLMPKSIKYCEDIESVYDDKLKAILRLLIGDCFARKPVPIITSSTQESLTKLACSRQPMKNRLTLCAKEEDIAEAVRIYCQKAEVFSLGRSYEEWSVVLILSCTKINPLSPLDVAVGIDSPLVIIEKL